MTKVKMSEESLNALRLPELQAMYTEIVGEPTRTPNKTWLVRKILESSKTRVTGSKTSTSTKTMSVEELRARHQEIIGRPTGSTDVAYLRWRLRQAERGLIRVGAEPRVGKGKPAISLCRRVHGEEEIRFLKKNRQTSTEYFRQLCGGNGTALEAFVNNIEPGPQEEKCIRDYLKEHVMDELAPRNIMLPSGATDGLGKYPIIEFEYRVHVEGQNLQGTKVELKELIDRLVKEFTANCVIW